MLFFGAFRVVEAFPYRAATIDVCTRSDCFGCDRLAVDHCSVSRNVGHVTYSMRTIIRR